MGHTLYLPMSRALYLPMSRITKYVILAGVDVCAGEQ